MKNLNLKNLNLEEGNVLQRNQLKTVVGGGSSVCATGRTVHFTWSCPDGSASGSAVTCPEFLQAYNDMLNDFCGL
ncbi:hypothetical protein GCM10011531_06900 [Aquaticitalea lipolytica]|uniref:Uncharacterized protein n=1 Tax=Aquaticitalea lipolytica TaxID=1247562 RepID=A0A8J2TLL4_9FLAO|nr:hypothetical protein [Aquaticitalea lipolytica]GFZ79631.1 hypothetical protein GCM10011531_06900 [Aquaticitalea lipolytica]